MSTETPASDQRITHEHPGTDPELIRTGRDAAATKRALVRAARRRFAADGFRTTTVRQIAADVGVNVALINRYFGSKEGLFEACMRRTSDELSTPAPNEGSDVSEVIDRLIERVTSSSNGDDPLQLLLLLRSSGDENADGIRRATLIGFTKRLAMAAGWDPDDAGTGPILLQAQLAISMMLGIVVLRASAAVEPLASSAPEDLAVPLRRVLRTLLDHPIE
jgi:AcrR family transcriptional regulator